MDEEIIKLHQQLLAVHESRLDEIGGVMEKLQDKLLVIDTKLEKIEVRLLEYLRDEGYEDEK